MLLFTALSLAIFYFSITSKYFCLHVHSLVNKILFMYICNHLYVDWSLISFKFVTIFIWICCHLHVYLLLVLFRFVMIFLWICDNICQSVSIRFVTIFIFIWEKMIMNNIQNMNTSQFTEEFGCLPSTHVEASLNGWPNNHIRACILKQLLVVLLTDLYVGCLNLQIIHKSHVTCYVVLHYDFYNF